MIRREIEEGSIWPDSLWGFWPYGVAWDEPRIEDRNYTVVCYLIPWNWVRALTHWLTWKLRVPTPLRGRIIEAQKQKGEDGVQRRAARLRQEYRAGFMAAVHDHQETVSAAMHYCPWPDEDTLQKGHLDSWEIGEAGTEA